MIAQGGQVGFGCVLLSSAQHASRPVSCRSSSGGSAVRPLSAPARCSTRHPAPLLPTLPCLPRAIPQAWRTPPRCASSVRATWMRRYGSGPGRSARTGRRRQWRRWRWVGRCLAATMQGRAMGGQGGDSRQAGTQAAAGRQARRQLLAVVGSGWQLLAGWTLAQKGWWACTAGGRCCFVQAGWGAARRIGDSPSHSAKLNEPVLHLAVLCCSCCCCCCCS